MVVDHGGHDRADLGLVLRGVTASPTRRPGPRRRARTYWPWPSALNSGPPGDLAGLADVARLAHASGVTGHSGPFPVAFPVLRANGHTDAVLAEGRNMAPAPVDQPDLSGGSWVRSNGIVVERSFADALGIHAGERVTLNGLPFRVAGVAVTAALPTSGIGFLERQYRSGLIPAWSG